MRVKINGALARFASLSAIFGMAAPAHAEVISLQCDFTREVRSEMSGGPGPRVRSESYSGSYRIDTSARTVTAGFTYDEENQVARSDSRFISDIRAMDMNQAVFCEDDLNGCQRKDVDTGRARGWSLKSPTVIDLRSMRVSASSKSYFASASGRTSISTDWRLTGFCRRK